MSMPDSVRGTGLFARLASDAELLSIVESLRSVVEVLAQTTARSVPDFTDHTVKHMDALWSVTDQILTSEEIEQLTSAEAFLLSCGFYLHDIGMAHAATEEGVERLKDSAPYKSFIARLPVRLKSDPAAQAQGIALAIRQLHAGAATEWAVSEIPGSCGRYLFEALSVRETWALTCGEIASSHHWSIAQIERKYGSQSVCPMPGGRKADLLYVCACLRLIDYAHINRERASSIERAFRDRLQDESLVHWLAQEHIDGPIREKDELIYRASSPISNVDAWWLYFEMLTGLDNEIRSVRRLLDQRQIYDKKISLNGVRGVATPEQAARLIPTTGFLPIEVNLRTGSVDRLVELLAGETLYGPNPMAAVRELIQNARDAVMLKAEVAVSEAEKALLALPISVSLNTAIEPPLLEIVDHGIGMTRRVMTDYLIAIASDYWTSQFAIDYPEVANRGFKNAGKFGIGFLSVFMLGDEVQVESNRIGGERYRMTLRGVGRRGELREVDAPGGSGTAIRVKLRKSSVERIGKLFELVSVYAPTLPHKLVISVDGKKNELASGWLQKLAAKDFDDWVSNAIRTLRGNAVGSREISVVRYLYSDDILWRAPDEKVNWAKGAPQYVEGNTRLVCSFEGTSILCARGLAVQSIKTPGFRGVVELDDLKLSVNRSRTVNADITSVLDAARASVAAQIIENLDSMSGQGLLVNKTSFFSSCVRFYGKEVLLGSKVPWLSHLTFPGNAELIDSSTMLQRAGEANSVFVSFNTGPWTAMKQWESAAPMQGEIALLLDGEGQPRPSFRMSQQGPNLGKLNEIFQNWNDSPLFSVLIELISQAWQITPSDLVSQEPWTHQADVLYGRLARQSAPPKDLIYRSISLK
jgi:hypothetical protein